MAETSDAHRCPVADRAYYDAMSHDQLVARLKVAEDALVLIGWTSIGHTDTERGKAAEQMWHIWAGMVRGEFTGPMMHPDLDAMVPQLAATRDRIRAQTLRAYGLDEED